ncbi:MAG: MFS transporter [Lentisphaerae bacterium]|jgi:predicted MFS family arabinose efflux permease|nr:MFS transporter [Lentisphaerota bacterium]
MTSLLRRFYTDTYRPRAGALPFLTSTIVWGIGIGCFAASLNNFLVDVYDLNQFQRGMLEFFREMPGLMLVFLLALFHRTSDWRVFRIGILISMVGVTLLVIPVNFHIVTLLIMIWSTGEHLTMPVRNSISMHVAKEGRAGVSLGFTSSAFNAGHVLGNLLVAAIFMVSMRFLGLTNRVAIYNIVWILIAILMAASLITTLTKRIEHVSVKRPRLLFKKKFSLYYGLELFYGARKQIFFTFGPFLLIREFGVDTGQMALLLGIAAVMNMIASPWIGKLTDYIGYRTVMVYDTFILVFVCLLYGYASQWFAYKIAFWVVCINFLLDALISTTSMAANIYVRDISSNRDETTSTLSTGISMNHFISILVAPVGGWVWMNWGAGTLFTISAIMALGNSLFAMMIPIRSRQI